MKKFEKLKCECGGKLELKHTFDGCDWNSEHGEGSKFDYPILFVCQQCGSVYEIGRTKKFSDFDESKEKCY